MRRRQRRPDGVRDRRTDARRHPDGGPATDRDWREPEIGADGEPWPDGLFAKTAAGLILGDALALVLVAATLVILALAGFRSLALLRLGGLALGAAAGVVFLRRTILLLAAAGIRQRIGAGIAFGIGKRAQHDAGAGRIRTRSAASATTLRRDLGHGRSRGRSLGRRSLVLDSSAWRDGTPLDRLDHHRLRAAMGEALAHHALFDGALQRQRLGRHMESLVARVFRIIHSAQILRVACSWVRRSRYRGQSLDPVAFDAAIITVTMPAVQEAIASSARDKRSMYHICPA